MPRHVQGPLGGRCDDRVALGIQDAVLFVERAGDDSPARADDHRIARVVPLLEVREQPRALWEIFRDVLAPHRGPVAQHPAPPFGRNVPHCRDPRAALVPGRRDVDLAALREDRKPRQRHVVLPADQPADPSHRGVADAQAAGVAGSPHHALRVRRHQLPMAVQHLAVGPDQDHGVVQRASAELAVAFVDADRYRDLQPPRRRLDWLEVSPVEVDRVLDEPAVDLTRQLKVRPGAQAPQPLRVAREPGLGKRDETGAGGGRFLEQLHSALERLRAVQSDGWVLDDRHAVRGRLLFSRHGRHVAPSRSALAGKVARPGEHAGQLLAQLGGQPLRSFDQRVEVDAGDDAETAQ